METAPLIDTAALAALLDSPRPPVLADCRFELANPSAGETAWKTAHLPGSVYLHLERDLSAPKGSTGGRHPMPEPGAFEALMQRIGLDADSLLVALDDGSHAFAARLWWMARYFGHARVTVLDGGIAAWSRAGLPLTQAVAAQRPGNFRAQVQPGMRIDHAQLRERLGDLALADARDARRYAGIEDTVDPRAGHIPGAVHMPWQGALGPDGRMADATAQRARWEWLGADGRPPVMYCGSGVTACLNLLSLALAGIDGARLYPGSWSDWCQQDGPVATGPEP
jgi:thiosulfate/3-mercaptopyruvate sulfurtransferase